MKKRVIDPFVVFCVMISMMVLAWAAGLIWAGNIHSDNRVTITYLGPVRFQDAIGRYLKEEGFGDQMRHVSPNQTPDITVRALSMEAWSLFSEKSHNDLASAFSWVDKTSEKYEISIEGESAEFEFGWDREKGKLIPMTFPGNFAVKAIIQKELEKFEAKRRALKPAN